MLPPLVAGFMLSSFAAFALVYLAGTAFRSIGEPSRNLCIIALLVSCAAVDLLFPRIRPSLMNRQTPRGLSGRFSLPMTGFLWGLDTGTVVSTFRSSAASWAALLLTLAGWGPWWGGVAYGAGFSIPLAVLVGTHSTDPYRPEWRRRSTESLVTRLGGASRYVRIATAAVALIAAVVAFNGMLSSIQS